MAKNTLVINCALRETRVALVEDGVIAELQIERAAARGTVGNVVLGKVTRVLPGMQAAFIDVGMERAAFLHVEDLIRPNDFEAYLSGGAREDHDRTLRGTGRRTVHGNVEDEEDDDSTGEDDADGGSDESPDDGEDLDDEVAGPSDDEDDDAPSGGDDRQGVDEESTGDDPALRHQDRGGGGDQGGAMRSHLPARRRRVVPAAVPVADVEEAGADDDEDDDDFVETDVAQDSAREPGEGDELGAEEAPDSPETEGEPEPDANDDTGGAKPDDDRSRRGRKRRRKRRDEGRTVTPREGGDARSRDSRFKRHRRGRSAKKQSSRVSRSVPITDVVKEGDDVIVQISKEPIGTKGARVTSHISLPGRYVVYLPTVDHVGISKRIGSPRERMRLREVMESLKPDRGGLIVRTVAEGLTKKNLKSDVGYLIKLWSEISRKRDGARAPTVLYTELDLVLKTARDLFTDDIAKIVIDDKEQHARLVRFVEMFLPDRVKDVELYSGREPLFDAYGIEDEIGRALSRKVPLPSGGYLIIDQAEALSAIDVNTGRFIGKGSKDLEETALKTNLEAVEEIAYQLRFRNIGGLIILDLIDMDTPANRDRVFRELERQLARDKAKTTINRISELGLIEMTRKRTRESLSRMLHEPCFYCDGTGQIMSRTTIAYEILRQIRRELEMLPGYSIVVNAHPAIIDLLQSEERVAVEEAERRYMRRIELNACREYHIEQFDLMGK